MLRVLNPPESIEDEETRCRLGRLFRQFREGAGQSLRDTVEALSSVESPVMLGEIERGQRLASAEQIQEFCNFIGVETETFCQSATDFHRSIWEPRKQLLELDEQIAKVSSTGPIYDQRELVSTLDYAISSMNVVSDILVRCSRILIREENTVQDGKLAMSANATLQSAIRLSQCVLNNPLDPLLVNPPDWDEMDNDGGGT